MSEITIGKDLISYYEGRSVGPAQCHHIRRAMGIPAGKLPKERVASQVVGDTMVYVLSPEQALVRTALQHNGSPSHRPHRMYARCNHCGKDVPTGRFGQHMKIHNE